MKDTVARILEIERITEKFLNEKYERQEAILQSPESRTLFSQAVQAGVTWWAGFLRPGVEPGEPSEALRHNDVADAFERSLTEILATADDAYLSLYTDAPRLHPNIANALVNIGCDPVVYADCFPAGMSVHTEIRPWGVTLTVAESPTLWIWEAEKAVGLTPELQGSVNRVVHLSKLIQGLNTEKQGLIQKLRHTGDWANLYTEALKAGARWWAQYLRTDGPKAEWDSGDALLNAQVGALRSLLPENRDDTLADAFERAFVQYFSDKPIPPFGGSVGVDYHPDRNLNHVIGLAGGNPDDHHMNTFPIKTRMAILPYCVSVSKMRGTETIWTPLVNQPNQEEK